MSRTLSSTLLASPALRVPAEQATNHNFYFDSPIVPDSLKELPADEQVRPNTPGIDKLIGGLTGAAPLKVQAARQGVSGNLLSGDPATALGNTLVGASGSKPTNEFYKAVEKASPSRASVSKKINEALAAGDTSTAQQLAADYNTTLKETFSPWAEKYGSQATAAMQDTYNALKLNLTRRSVKQRRRSILEKSTQK